MHPNADNLIASRFDTVIYDLDGTLIDSARDMCVAVSRVLADHGLPPISDEDARIFMGEGSKVTMRRAFAKYGRTLDDAQASAVTREFVRYYEADPVQPHDGLRRRGRSGRPLRPAGPEAGRLYQQVREIRRASSCST